jgi:hypothetical protein
MSLFILKTAQWQNNNEGRLLVNLMKKEIKTPYFRGGMMLKWEED